MAGPTSPRRGGLGAAAAAAAAAVACLAGAGCFVGRAPPTPRVERSLVPLRGDRKSSTDNFIDKAFTVMADMVVAGMPLSQQEKDAYQFYRDGMAAQTSGDYSTALRRGWGRHAGCSIDNKLLATLRGLQRVACAGAGRGGIRRAGMTSCNHCGRSTPTRPLAVGDLIVGPRTGMHVETEIAVRTRMWEAKQFEALLSRLEAQRILGPRGRRGRRSRRRDDAAEDKKRRSRKQTAEGAYRKAINTMTSEDAQCSAQAQARHASELIPRSERPDALWVRPGGAQPSDGNSTSEGGHGNRPDGSASQEASLGPASHSDDHPLKGVRHAALTAPGPTGTRAARAKECLGCASQVVANKLCRVLLRAQYHQWGVEMPGGAEALVHWGGHVEETAMDGTLEPLVAFDLDLENMFGIIEWAEIREAVRRDLEEAEGWFQWEHETPEEIELPSGDVAVSDRGAGQGGVFGSSISSLTFGHRIGVHMQRHQGSLGDDPSAGAVGEWFIDGGQAFVRPAQASAWLRSVDAALAAFGGRRSTGAACKSVAWLLCPEARMTEFQGWANGYISDTCRVEEAATAPKAAWASIMELDHPQCELTLQRRCLDVSKCSYILRCNGDRIPECELHRFDDFLRVGVETSLAGRLPDVGWIQATLAVDAGGIGMRESAAIALPAFIASRVSSRPLVNEMFQHIENAGIGSRVSPLHRYDQRTNAALRRWLDSLPQGARDQVHDAVERAAGSAERRWRDWRSGEEGDGEANEEAEGPARPRGSRRPAAGLVPDASAEDPEYPASPAPKGGPRLQSELVRFGDATVAHGPLAKMREAGDWGREQLLSELSHPDGSHEWLWAVDPNKGKTLSKEDFVTAGTEVHVEERRIWWRISTEIWRRAARMIRRCLPSHAQEVADEDDAYHDPDVEFRRGHPGSVDPSPAGSASAAAPSG
ncbi:unnamed protein product [Prorocentrum cordatum]|uniref:Reverse transcriptase domain-containing protein n=1 Tax=Prorocentrum cordatum TaxID=2364126 RepID=A0ABN9WIS7_9DINO|nr:unnamed protein product [Polarella glacialis]